MARYASNKYALGISDRSGATYKLRHMRKEWTGMLVGKDEWESKQPQLSVVKTPADPQALRNPRPDRTEPAVTVLLSFNPFLSGSSGSAVITATEPGHGRSTGDTVRFRIVRIILYGGLQSGECKSQVMHSRLQDRQRRFLHHP